jgi:hypothetical protein
MGQREWHIGRLYAGILGPVAFAAMLSRGLLEGSSVDGTLRIATLCLFAFAGVGYLAGRVADSIITESVQTRFQQEMKAHDAAGTVPEARR